MNEDLRMQGTVKMIVTDLDGTLLRDDKTISDYTLSVLEKCRIQGIKVVYATARGGSTQSSCKYLRAGSYNFV